jgi:hypothetical protein
MVIKEKKLMIVTVNLKDGCTYTGSVHVVIDQNDNVWFKDNLTLKCNEGYEIDTKENVTWFDIDIVTGKFAINYEDDTRIEGYAQFIDINS